MKLDKFWKLAALLNSLVIAVLVLLVIVVRFVLNMENLEMRYVITMGFIVVFSWSSMTNANYRRMKVSMICSGIVLLIATWAKVSMICSGIVLLIATWAIYMTRDPIFMTAFLTNTMFLIGTALEMREYKKRRDLF